MEIFAGNHGQLSTHITEGISSPENDMEERRFVE
jgi:hypothetical protein